MILIVAFLFIALNLWVKARSFLDPDFGWHLRMGQLILQKGLPQTDPFSYTMPSFPVVGHEWLVDVGIARMFPLLGLDGLSLLFTLLALVPLVVMTVVSKAKWRFLPFFLAGLSLMPFLGIRPQIIPWVLFSWVILLLLKEELWNRFKWILPLLLFLWANIHGSFVLGFLIIVLFVLLRGGESYQQRARTRLSRSRWLLAMSEELLLLACCFFVTFINPYGWHVWGEVWSSVSDTSLRWAIVEWLPGVFLFNDTFFILLASSLLLVLRYKKKFRPVDLALYYALLLMGVVSVRHLPFWLLLSIPMTSQGLAYLHDEVKGQTNGEKRFKLAYKIAIFCVIGVGIFDFLLLIPDARYAQLSNAPQRAVAFLKANPSPGNIFAEYGYGGYLIWQYPEKKVFIDGRMPSWKETNAPVGESRNAFVEYELMMSGSPQTKALFAKYHIDTVMLSRQEDREDLANFFRRITPLHLVNKPKLRQQLQRIGMKEVYRDELVVIYRKKSQM